jgi:hypothetical protein
LVKLEAEILELDRHMVVGEGVVEVEEVDYLREENTGLFEFEELDIVGPGESDTPAWHGMTVWLDVAGYDELWGQKVEMVGY